MRHCYYFVVGCGFNNIAEGGCVVFYQSESQIVNRRVKMKLREFPRNRFGRIMDEYLLTSPNLVSYDKKQLLTCLRLMRGFVKVIFPSVSGLGEYYFSDVDKYSYQPEQVNNGII